MKTFIIITQRPGLSPAQPGYFATVRGKFGGGYQGAHAGNTPDAAARFAAREILRYGSHNRAGYSILAPTEVLQALQPELRGNALPTQATWSGEIH